jgi:polyisoprenoid-binding protein YceI
MTTSMRAWRAGTSLALLLQMTSRLLQALGAVFVLALVAGAIFGLVVVKDRVRIVVTADETTTGPDPVALLRDDVMTLARDLAALQQAIGSNFERLAEELDSRAVARHADVAALQQELAALRPMHTALGQQVAAMQAQVQAQLQALAGDVAAEARVGAAPVTAPAAEFPVGLAVAPPEPAPAANTTDQPRAVSPASTAPTKPRRGFLSFAVPAAEFRFDAPQDYTLIPDLCRVGFDAKSTLHDFTGVTSRVRGGFRADCDDPDGAWTGSVTADAASLVTGVDGRDASMREHLDTKHHGEITFTIERFHPAAGGVDVAKATARGEIAGTMTIRGQQRPFRMPLTVEVDPQRRVVLTGQAPLKLSDYGVPVPSQLGVINMQDEVVVWIALRARVAAGARK